MSLGLKGIASACEWLLYAIIPVTLGLLYITTHTAPAAAGDTIYSQTDNFTRPANTDAYAAADLVANSVTAGSVVPLTFTVGDDGAHLVRIVLSKSDTDAANADFVVHIFGSDPTVANGDNGAISVDFADKVGEVDLTIMEAGTDDAFIVQNLGATSIHLEQGTYYILLEAEAAYTPASAEVFTIKLVFDQEGF
jgi:hypothetical protein